MSERERETAFLRGLISYDQSAESRKVNEEITHLQGQVRVLQRAMCWMGVLAALAVVFLGFALILCVDYPDNMWRFLRHVGVKVPCALGLASVSSLACFTCLGVVYRNKLDRRREKARRLAERLLASRLGAAAGVSELKTRDEMFEVPIAFRSVSG